MRRLDRESLYTLPIWVGLFLSGIYVLAVPQMIHSIPNWSENALGLALSVGAAGCLYGAAQPDWRRAYRAEMAGLAVVTVVLGLLAIFGELTLAQMFTLTGSLGAMIQIGSLRAMVEMWLALRRDS